MKSPLNLSRRERQIIEALYRLEEASVADVQDAIEDPPGYSAVRALLSELVRKKQIAFRRDGKRYLYRPKQSRTSMAKRLLGNIIQNFFQGKPGDAICTLLDESALSEEELLRIKDRLKTLEKERRK